MSDQGQETVQNFNGDLFNDITSKIKQITNDLVDDESENDNNAKIEGENLCKVFDESFKEYLDENPDKLQELKKVLGDSIIKIIVKFKNDNDGKIPEEFKPLLDFAKSLGIELHQETGGDNDKENLDYPLNDSTLEGINREGDNQDFFKGKDEEVGINDKVEGDNDSRVDKTKKTIKDQKEMIDGIYTSKLSEEIKGKIQQLKQLLENINIVVSNTSPENVRILQGYISDNLSGKDKESFDKASKKRNNTFDGKFGIGTLDGLDKVLEKTGKYIEKVKDLNNNEDDSGDSSENSENNENLDNITAKTDVKIKKGGKIKPEELINGTLPEGFTVSLADGQNIDTNNPGNIKVNIVIKKGEDVKKRLEVNVKIEDDNENHEGGYEGGQETTTPLTLNGQQHQAISEGQIPTNVPGATFYSVTAGENNELISNNGEDVECLMTLSGAPNEVYKVKVDEKGNLCPIIENVNSHMRILLKNIPSCIAYLTNKIPPNLPGDPYIAWNSKNEDYVIRTDKTDRGTMGLTIEPMTIDGKWISKDLSTCLVLENFINLLRGNKTLNDVDFRNDNPDLKLKGYDLYVRVNRKSNRTYDSDNKPKKQGRWLKIDKSQFGIKDIETEDLKKFVKYNNHEDWEDNRDKKKDNKYYKKM